MIGLEHALARVAAARGRGRAALAGLRTPARAVDSAVRAQVEPRLRHDFGDVRLHDDARAADAARAIGSTAFTVGRDVVLGERADTRVLTHELVHVVQQRGATGTVEVEPSERGEAEAERAAAGDGGSIEHREPRRVLQRQPLPDAGSTRDPGPQGLRPEAVPDAGPRREQDAGRVPALETGLASESRLAELEGMTVQQLANAPAAAVRDTSGYAPPAGQPSFADYARARGNIDSVLRRLGFPGDPETRRGAVGIVPRPAALRVLDANLERILNRPGVASLVGGAGGRGIPRAAPGGRPTLAGRARIATTLAEYVVKHFQVLITWIGVGADVDGQVRELWPDVADGTIVPQERKVAILDLVQRQPPAGFYSPLDDMFYLPPAADLSLPGIEDVARHETVHLLGGRAHTREAFRRRFPTDWLRHWSTFEEGVSEFISREASPTGGTQQRETVVSSSTSRSQGATTTVEVTTGPGYGSEVAVVQRLIARLGRDVVLRAYFTGEIPPELFTMLEGGGR